MGQKDQSQREPLFADVPGDRERVRAVLEEWGFGEASVRRLLLEQPALPERGAAEPPAALERRPPTRAGN